jgi:hypothetical protein
MMEDDDSVREHLVTQERRPLERRPGLDLGTRGRGERASDQQRPEERARVAPSIRA